MPAELSPIFSELTGHTWPTADQISRAVELMQDHLTWEAAVSEYLAVARWRRFPRLHRRIWVLYVREVPMSRIAGIVHRSKTRVYQVIERHRKLARGDF